MNRGDNIENGLLHETQNRVHSVDEINEIILQSDLLIDFTHAIRALEQRDESQHEVLQTYLILSLVARDVHRFIRQQNRVNAESVPQLRLLRVLEECHVLEIRIEEGKRVSFEDFDVPSELFVHEWQVISRHRCHVRLSDESSRHLIVEYARVYESLRESPREVFKVQLSDVERIDVLEILDEHQRGNRRERDNSEYD